MNIAKVFKSTTINVRYSSMYRCKFSGKIILKIPEKSQQIILR